MAAARKSPARRYLPGAKNKSHRRHTACDRHPQRRSGCTRTGRQSAEVHRRDMARSNHFVRQLALKLAFTYGHNHAFAGTQELASSLRPQRHSHHSICSRRFRMLTRALNAAEQCCIRGGRVLVRSAPSGAADIEIEISHASAALSYYVNQRWLGRLWLTNWQTISQSIQ